MAHSASQSLAPSGRPILLNINRGPAGYRFRFDLGPKILILDTDERGREFDCHLEWPPEFAVPPMARTAALEQVRKMLLLEGAKRG